MNNYQFFLYTFVVLFMGFGGWGEYNNAEYNEDSGGSITYRDISKYKMWI